MHLTGAQAGAPRLQRSIMHERTSGCVGLHSSSRCCLLPLYAWKGPAFAADPQTLVSFLYLAMHENFCQGSVWQWSRQAKDFAATSRERLSSSTQRTHHLTTMAHWKIDQMEILLHVMHQQACSSCSRHPPLGDCPAAFKAFTQEIVLHVCRINIQLGPTPYHTCAYFSFTLAWCHNDSDQRRSDSAIPRLRWRPQDRCHARYH